MIHLNTEINKVRETTYTDPILYAWGFNANYQLGVNTGTRYIKTPYKFNLSIIDSIYNKNDCIEDILINTNMSCLITKNKKIFVSYFDQTTQKSQKLDTIIRRESKEQKWGVFNKITTNKSSPNIFWTEITDTIYNHNKFSYEIEKLIPHNDSILFLSSNKRVFTKKKEKKMPNCQKILDRIIWDER